MADTKEINASVGCMGYGYTVKVTVNGVDIGMKGGMSESKRLMNTDHPMVNEATPEIRAQLFVLKPGENTVHVECKKTGGPNDRLTFDMYLLGQEEPLFTYSTSDAEGVFDKSFTL